MLPGSKTSYTLKNNWTKNMNSIYDSLKENKHIFIYSVSGRTGSTALQRILNSSNEICIFGESHSVSNSMLETIWKLESQNTEIWRKRVNQSFKLLETSFKEDNHARFYAKAVRPINSALNNLKDTFTSYYLPVNNVDRFGFKEIYISNEVNLQCLKKLFPFSYILFLFREPIAQFRSIVNSGYFSGLTVNVFLKRYVTATKMFIAHSKINSNCVFIDYEQLNNSNTIKSLLNSIDIFNFDVNLIANKINSTAGNDLDAQTKDKIKSSEAFNHYLMMREMSKDML